MQVRLPLSPSSAYAARVAASGFLVELGRSDLRDAVALIASELVANAVMHAHTEMSLSVDLADDGVRVSVTDSSDVLPRWTLTSQTATSGRGLLLVKQLSRRWGVDPLPGGGKSVWAEVDATSVEDDSSSPDDLLEFWSDEPWPTDAVGEAEAEVEVVEIEIEIDVQAMLDSRAHTDDLVRDLQLTLLDAAEAERASASDEVVALARRLDVANEDFREARRQILNQTVAAARRRTSRTTLRLRLHRSDLLLAGQWLEALDEADALTAAGKLLLPAFPSDLTAFRREYIGDITARLSDGAEGTAWVSQVPSQDVHPDVAARAGDLGYAGRYVPTDGTDEPIAGDFYDVLTLGEDLVALCVGDVAGHGPAVLPQMQVLRDAVRETALRLLGPVAVVAALDAYWESLQIETLATLWYGEYRPSRGELTYVSAGHPPPVLTVHGDPARLLAEASAPPLGVGLAHQHAANDTETLPPGAVLVAYSDGLVERRRTDMEEQLAALQRVVTAACDPAKVGTAKDIAADILNALVPDLDRAEDDVCVLVVMRRGPRAT
ncbi:MAG: SpoIIE family protein phosphatase [Actinomycetota bacterium]|nr:SpoIIE family protein phosphatase [Actinomycetota bacterium]